MATDDPICPNCNLCGKTYQYKDGPLMLPCLHSFCRPCLVKYIKKEKSAANKMACPSCNARFPLPKDVDDFPVNLRLSRLAKSTAYEKQAEGGNVKCQLCDDNPKEATSFCCNCCEFLCKKCKYHHLSEDEDHKVIELATYKKGELEIHPLPPKCPQHSKREAEIFCEDCEILICSSCAHIDHQKHESSSLGKSSEKQKTELQEMTSGVVKALGKMDQALQQIQEMKDKVKVSAEEATTRIDKACDDLIQAVENRRKVLQRKRWEIAKGKHDVLSNQMVEIECLRRDLGFAQLHAKDAINTHSLDEILSMKKAIQLRLNRAMAISQQISMDLKEDDTINTSLQIESLLEEIQKFGFFPSVPDPSRCRAEVLSTPLVSVGKEIKVTVALEDETGKPIEGVANFQYQLRKVGDDFDVCIPPKVNIMKSNNGTATMGFTPDQPGEYEVTIMVRNRPIANPYKITARQPRNYMLYMTMVLYMLVITVIIPSKCSDQMVQRVRLGVVIKLVDNCHGITILDNTIYVVDRGSQMVKMYSTDGRFIGSIGRFGEGNGQFDIPVGICTDGWGRVLVTEYSNKRIQVFSSNGKFITSFPCSTSPYDVAVDSVGNIHVALYSNNHIAVYSQDGGLIENYDLRGNLRGPTGIYIDGEGNRLIAARGNNQVHIANPTGTLISTRQFKEAIRATMDKNGVIYVAECDEKRVSILQ